MVLVVKSDDQHGTSSVMERNENVGKSKLLQVIISCSRPVQAALLGATRHDNVVTAVALPSENASPTHLSPPFYKESSARKHNPNFFRAGVPPTNDAKLATRPSLLICLGSPLKVLKS
ncbi:hypothetical protein Baya_7825 [Bagarius yarrelli]|uniref:Uncharacterized protein n=1 Tax=Bagarius yarrelli TaxID=175774 RepID=A0A556U2Y7_BAGYA|nr:hypothetical protein Baya_7825 [Bagarius yarrelli]